jgi:perosamine synthetase
VASITFDRIIEFIRDLYPDENPVPLHRPKFEGNEKKYLAECIDSTYVSSAGMFVNRFEEMISEYTGSPYSVATVNGTAALHISLILCNTTSGCEVITQPLSFIATSNAIKYTGAEPVFIDIDLKTLGMSAGSLEEYLRKNIRPDNKGISYNVNTGKKITACLPVNIFGHPCRIDRIVELCSEYNIPVIEDAAESIGSFYKGHHTGTYGLLGILSFNGNKTITTGGGGMILTRKKELAMKARHLTTQAKVNHPWEYDHDEIGFNYRMPNINAALGCAQLEQITGMIKRKRALASEYQSFFSGSDIQFVSEPPDSSSNYWLNAIILKDKSERDSFLRFTNERGIMSRPAWKLINQLNMYRNSRVEDIRNAEWIADRLVNLPSSI